MERAEKRSPKGVACCDALNCEGGGYRAAWVEQGYLVSGGEIQRLAALESSCHPLAVGVHHVGDPPYGDALARLHLDVLAYGDPRQVGVDIPSLRVEHL